MVDRNLPALALTQARRETLRGSSLAAYHPGHCGSFTLTVAGRLVYCHCPTRGRRSRIGSTSGRRLSASVALVAGMGEPGVMDRDGTVTKCKPLDQRDRVPVAGGLVTRSFIRLVFAGGKAVFAAVD
jgi:hypothetical protein